MSCAWEVFKRTGNDEILLYALKKDPCRSTQVDSFRAMILFKLSCKKGDIESLEFLCDLFEIDNSVSYLEAACYNGHIETAKWLVNHFKYDGDSAFYQNIVATGDLEMTEWMVDHFSIQKTQIFLLLVSAFETKHYDVVDWFVQKFGVSKKDIKRVASFALNQDTCVNEIRERYGVNVGNRWSSITFDSCLVN